MLESDSWCSLTQLLLNAIILTRSNCYNEHHYMRKFASSHWKFFGLIFLIYRKICSILWIRSSMSTIIRLQEWNDLIFIQLGPEHQIACSLWHLFGLRHSMTRFLLHFQNYSWPTEAAGEHRRKTKCPKQSLPET